MDKPHVLGDGRADPLARSDEPRIRTRLVLLGSISLLAIVAVATLLILVARSAT